MALPVDGVSAPLLYTPAEAADVLRVCRTTVYALLRSGELKSVVVSKRRRLIPAQSIDAYITGLMAHEAG